MKTAVHANAFMKRVSDPPTPTKKQPAPQPQPQPELEPAPEPEPEPEAAPAPPRTVSEAVRQREQFATQELSRLEADLDQILG